MTKARDNATQGGLTLINETSFSSSSSVSFTNLTAGSRYKILIEAVSNTNNNWMAMRFRDNSVDKSSNYYGANGAAFNSGSVGIYATVTNGDRMNIVLLTTVSNEMASASMDLFIDSTAVSARINGVGYASYYRNAVHFGYENTPMTNANGFTIYPVAGNMTGNIKLYKYR